MEDNTCDNCGVEAELYHNEASGLAFCDACDSAYDAATDEDEDTEAEGFHAELRQIIEQAEGTDLAPLIPHAQALLALPEESVEAMVEAARLMVVGASAGR